MFASPTDIAMGSNQSIVYQNNQSQGSQQRQQSSHPQQQMLSQYGGYQQQQPYLAYPNTNTNPAAAAAAKGGAVNSVSFQPYVPQQQMFPYNYPAQHAANSQYVPPVPPQQVPVPAPAQPRNVNYIQQGNNNSTNQYTAGNVSTPHAYRGGRGGRGGGYGHFHRQVHNNYYYNQQHHYSSNNAVPEKTPTVHLIHPDTKKILSIKLNRIYSTMADIRPQLQHQKSHHHNTDSNNVSVNSDSKNERSDPAIEAAPGPKFDPKTTQLVLCTNFLSSQGCIHGSGCDKVHIAGLEYTWPQVEAQVVEKDGKKTYAAGFFVHCYDPTLTRYYKVPSECITVTKGSTDYVSMYNDHGDNSKSKFKLCPSVVNHATCSKGGNCEDIHCSIADLEAVREGSANATHLNNAAAMKEVPRLPADMTVRVFNQNSFDTWHDYPGSNVLVTDGAKTYQKQYEQEMHSVPTRKRMQHCAHFRLKDMCRLGESCRFLHVLPTEQEIKERREVEAAAVAKSQEEAAKETATTGTTK